MKTGQKPAIAVQVGVGFPLSCTRVGRPAGDAMTFWRMQLHPSESQGAIRHTVQSNQRHYWAFAHEMKVGDRVLLFAHHFPFALARVSGNYNYIRAAAPEIGV